jgi:MFS family permease
MKMDLLQTKTESVITKWLKNSHGFLFSLYATLTAFCLYTCVYAFRKTYSAATFEGISYAGIDYKVWLVTAQVVGYALSKFIGIKVISELKAHSRSFGILLMVAIAGASWLLFGLVPAPYNIIFLFTNGLPLGMIWGMVFSYLEGRRFTEVLGAGLSVSFIFSAGLCKSVGGFIIRDWGTSETWMPFVASTLFILPLLLFLWLLDKLPPPSALDEQLRTKRQPMNGEERKDFVKSFLPGIVLFVLGYMLLTTFREFRDNFSAEIWKTLGYGNSPAIFTQTEIPVSIVVLIVMGSIMVIKNNKLALMVNHGIIIFGMMLIGLATYFFEIGQLTAPVWMALIGLGLYLGYVPFNSIFFDRLLAAFNYAGTVGFIMYVADSFGYLGSVGVLFFKQFGYANLSWLNFFIRAGYFISVTGTLLIIGSMVYFHFKQRSWSADQRQVNQ